MNDLFLTLGIESWKALLAALLLPPVPFIVLVLVGSRLMPVRRITAWLFVVAGLAGIWFSSTTLAGTAITRSLLKPPPALGAQRIADLRRATKTAIVVLGAGRRSYAPEYGVAMLKPMGIERLRYGIWLSRETSLPLAFSGGVGPGAPAGPSEATIAARVAEREFGRPLRWTEAESRDTRENAIRSVALMKSQGIEQIVVVTSGYHMRRALRNFERAVEAAGSPMRIVAAPMGLPSGGRYGARDWLPSRQGFETTRLALHELLGLIAGA